MACIYGAASSVPKYNMSPSTIHQLFQNKVFDYDEKTLQKLSGILKTCDFTNRPCCVDFSQFTDERVRGDVYPTAENLFAAAQIPFRPSLTDRVKVWEQAVKELAVEAALSVLATTGTLLSDVECVITNTSTGVILPNLDTWLLHSLGLPNVKCHYPVDNTGCGGAITCLDIARSTLLAGKARIVLIVTVDCCSPHMNTNGEVKLEGILPNLLFGDGAGAIVVGPPKPGTWLIDGPTGALLGKDTAGDIDLKLGKDGYLLTLSRQLVHHLAAHLTHHWKGLVESYVGLEDPAKCEWLIHPGGRAILNVFRGLSPSLSEHDMRHSLSVMADRGNLVSATLVFVLERMLAEHSQNTACLVGPGPGTEIKVMTLHKVN